jgi:hypothetical protein
LLASPARQQYGGRRAGLMGQVGRRRGAFWCRIVWRMANTGIEIDRARLKRELKARNWSAVQVENQSNGKLNRKVVLSVIRKGRCLESTRGRLETVLGLDSGALDLGSEALPHALADGGHALTSGHVRYLVGKKALYESATEICQLMTDTIRIVISTDAPRVTEAFVRNLAVRMRERLEAEADIRLDVAYIVDRSKADRTHFQKELEWRNAIMREHGVPDSCRHIRIIEAPPLPRFDVLVVDTLHAQLGFASRGQKGEIFRAIEFRDLPGVVGNLADWCDAVLKEKGGQDYADWLGVPAPQGALKRRLSRPTSARK